MNATSIVWRGLTLGAGSVFRIRTLEGWEELPPSRYDKRVRARAHGAHPSSVYADERLVVVEGYCWSSTDRDALLKQLQRFTAFGSDIAAEPLAITAAGRTLTAGAQLLQARPMLLRGEWGIGRFGWLLQWRCPDPLRYDAAQTLSTGLPVASGGLAYPLAYPLDYGTPGATGQITLSNGGTADAPIAMQITGSLPQGFEVSAAGQRLTYPVVVPSGQTIGINTDDGTVLIEGTASRRGNLTNAAWMRVPRADPVTGQAGILTLQFTSLGGVFDAAARLAATVKPAFW